MKKAIADVLQKQKNMWVYDPSGSGVGNKSIIKQFVDQFLFMKNLGAHLLCHALFLSSVEQVR
jgi:hypothetical protein